MHVWQADGELQFDGKLDFDGKLYLLIQYIVAGSVPGTDEVRRTMFSQVTHHGQHEQDQRDD